MPFRTPKLSMDERILTHLQSYHSHREEYVAPFATTQSGIEKGTRIARPHVSHLLRKLMTLGYIMERTSHVEGMSRRLKSYFLTDLGIHHTQRIGESSGFYIDFADRTPRYKLFVGRQREGKMFMEWLARKECRLLAVKGIAGIGKTTFVNRMIREHRREWNVFWFRFYQWSSLRNMMMKLGDFLREMGKGRFLAYMESKREMDVGEMLPMIEDSLRGTRAILIFDDYHKADRNIQGFLLNFAAGLGGMDDVKVILIGRFIPLFEDIKRRLPEKAEVEIALDGLDMVASQSILRSRKMPAADFASLCKLTRGHPLFLELIGEAKTLRPEDNLKSYIQKEILSKISEEERNVLERASVFRYPAYPKAFFGKEQVKNEIIETLVGKSLMQAGGPIIDVHDLLREYCYSSLGSKKKKRYHRDAADYYLQESGDGACMESIYQLQSAGEWKEAARLVAMRGSSLIDRGYLMEFLDLLNGFREENSGEKWMELLIFKGDILRIIGNWNGALRCYKECLALSKRKSSRMLMGIVHKNLGDLFRQKGDWKKSKEHFIMSMDLLSANASALADAYRGLGSVFWREGRLDEAEKEYKRSIALAERCRDSLTAGTTNIDLGNLYKDSGKWNMALKHYNKGLEILRGVGNINQLTRVYLNLGALSVHMGRLEEALEHFNRTIEESDRIGNQQRVAWGLFNAAEAHAKIGDMRRAEEDCERALALAERFDDKLALSYCFRVRGIILKFKEDWNGASDYFEKSIGILKKIHAPYHMAETYLEYGLMFAKAGSHPRALENFEKATSLFKQLGNREYLRRVAREKKKLQNLARSER